MAAPLPRDMYGEEWKETRIAFGSCSKQTLPQPLWAPIAAWRPHAWFWGGDAVYADRNLPVLSFWRWSGTAESVRADFEAQRARPEYAPMLALQSRGMVLDAARDDHDAGTNDANRFSPVLDEAQDAFLDFLGVPAGSPRRARRGMYSAHAVGPPGRRVKALLLDIRRHQDRMGVEADTLGEEQWAWLERELVLDNDAQLTLVVSGTQVASTNKLIAEGWKQFPASRRRLYALLDRARAETGSAAVVLSGDVHMAEVTRGFYCPPGAPGGALEVLDLTSSGMTHAWGRGSGLRGRAAEALYPRVADLSALVDGYYLDLNYATLAVDWEARPSPVLTATVRGADGLPRLGFERSLDSLRALVDAAPGTAARHACDAVDALAYGTDGLYFSGVRLAMLLSVLLLVVLPACCAWRACRGGKGGRRKEGGKSKRS